MVKEHKYQDAYELRKTKLATYQAPFDKLKKDMLHFKWTLDMNLESKASQTVRDKMAEIAEALFFIEREFTKNQHRKKK